ncbi:MAG: TauD/TfdA family dioxygenase [Xenococcaceae cyanobacterium MO_167.B52]|nr:TauD/TfdA family dioxygenase [Xenococcaceae cyanobacterium MO_167.B52]
MLIPIININRIVQDSSNTAIADMPSLAQSVLRALNAYPHFVIVSGYPPNKDGTNLVKLSQAICHISSPQSILQNSTPVSFAKVRVDPEKSITKGRVTQYSRTHLPLLPHTDSSYRTNPHDLVAFQCIVSDKEGGKSIMIPIEHILKNLPRETLELLRDSVYPFGDNLYPIICGAIGDEQIRYYQSQIERTIEIGASPLPSKYVTAIKTLNQVLEESAQSIEFALQPGQIVLMHNKKVLHGRTGFSPNSDRLIYRVRLHLGSDQNSSKDLIVHNSTRKPKTLPNSPEVNFNPSKLQLNEVTRLNIEGQTLLSKGKFAEAVPAFLNCLKISPDHYESGLALSSLADAGGDHKAAQAILHQVARSHPLIWEGKPQPQKPTILRIRGIEGSAYRIVQQSDGSYKSLLRGGHFSIKDLIVQEQYNWMIMNLLADNIDGLKSIPQFDLILNTIACPDRKRTSLLAVARFIDRYPHIPVINDPRRVLETTRDRNYIRLNMIPGVSFPKTEKLTWDGVSFDAIADEISGLGFVFPFIIRLVGSQTGSTVQMINNKSELDSYLQNSPTQKEYYVIQFQDCRNSKNVYNKTRIFFIDGNFYPVANLFNNSWNVHSGDRYNVMDKNQWMQEAEQSFLNNPLGYLGTQNLEKLHKIRDLVGLDFFGIDFTILPDGTLFIFELNAAMRHNFEHATNFPYTEPHLKRISNAFNAMIQRRLHT